MARSLTIRHVPDEVGDALASRAAARGQSLQEYVRLALIELAERPDPETWVARVRERKRRSESTLAPGIILEALRTDRR